MQAILHRDGRLVLGGQIFRAALGRGGVRGMDKHEGDGATPAGKFPLRRVLYRADRVAPFDTALPSLPIARDAGWCDAPGDPAYNTPVTLPYPASTETLWREDHLYDVIVVVGHNDNPVVDGAGSAIFLHLAPTDGGPTAGCVALKGPELRALLARMDRNTMLVVQPR